MATISFRCPNCGGWLVFDPERQQFKCSSCQSDFTETALLKIAEQKEAEAVQKAAAGEHSSLYVCNSCGAELVTDDTTAATRCYYCHSPVVLQGRLADDFRPDKVLPFVLSESTATDRFNEWVKGKWFIPKNFFKFAQQDKFSGVYYPYWLASYLANGWFKGEGRKITHTSTADYNITTTKHYEVERAGRISFNNVHRSALSKADRKLADGIHPYNFNEMEDFSLAYLSGFLAEKRDVEHAALRAGVEQELLNYVEPLLTADTQYDQTSGQTHAQFLSSDWTYVLLPAWVFTYRGPDNRVYYYAMNGQNGNVCGELPLSTGRLLGFCAGICAAVCGLLCLGGWLIW